MVFSDFNGKKISALGMGCMRLPIMNKNDAMIDVCETEKMIAYAFEHGINYFDTAWGYHSGNSESVIGSILSKHPRESYYIATKFPGYDLANMDKVEEIFEEQLKKTGMEYFDFYMLHNVCEMNIDAYLDNERYGIMPYLLKQKENGRIRHLGFSTHGSLEVMTRLLDKFGKNMEFCQIQLNWLDWDFQKAKEKTELLAKYGLPIIVMEPLRGGKLAVLSDEDTKTLNALRPNHSVPDWAFNYLLSLDNIITTLSGMSDFRQLKENISTFESPAPLNDTEKKTLYSIASGLLGAVPCTSCRYCTSYCPNELDIPMLIGLYNEHRYTDGGFLAPMTLQAYPEEKHPKACVGCRSCESVCPQNIHIADVLSDFAEKLKKK